MKPRTTSIYPSDRASIGTSTRSETIRNDDGEATVTIVTPQLLTTVARGRATLPMVHTYFRFFHEFLDAATHRVDVFHDWYESSQIDSEARATYPPSRPGPSTRAMPTPCARDEVRRRVLVLLALRGGELPSGYLAARFQHSWPTTTRHLKLLEEAGLVEVRREGRTSQYRLVHERLFEVIATWLAHLEPIGPSKTWAPTGPRTTEGLKNGSNRRKDGNHEHEVDRKDLPRHSRGRQHRRGGGVLRQALGHARKETPGGAPLLRLRRRDPRRA